MTSSIGDQHNETKFFYELTPEIVLSAVEHAGAGTGLRCTGRIYQLNSMENRVYEVEIEGDGSERSRSDLFRIVKFYRPGRWSEVQIREEHRFLSELSDREIPVVAPIANHDGETLHQLPTPKIWFASFRKAGGRCLHELSDEQTVWIGRLLARVHSVGSCSRSPSRLTMNPDTFGRQNLAFLLSQGLIPHELRESYSSSVETLCTLSAPLWQGLALQRIHGDCHFGNVLWNDAGPFLVDFDDMVEGPPVQDLWLLLPGRDAEAMRKLQLMLEGYEQLRSFDYATLSLIEPLRALRFIHFSAWIGRRWSDPAFKRAFPHFGTSAYWGEQVADLRDQISVIQQGGFVASARGDAV